MRYHIFLITLRVMITRIARTAIETRIKVCIILDFIKFYKGRYFINTMKRKVDRLIEYLSEKGISENKATLECGLSKGLICQAKSGKADIGNKAVEKILSTYTDLNRVWFLTGEGSMLKDSEQETPAQEQTTPDNSLLEYLQRKIAELEGKIEKLNDEKADLLQENAVLRYENMMLTPRKGDATDAEVSSVVGA